MTELENLTKLLEDQLSPIRENINDLKESQKQVLSILLTQARMDEKMKRVDEHLAECVLWRKKMEDTLIVKEKVKEIMMWDIIKILLYVLAGGTAGSIISKLIFH